MNRRAKWFLAAVVFGALVCAAALYMLEPSLPSEGTNAVIILGTLDLIAEALAIVMPNSVVGSIGFIPLLALAVIVPNWFALAATTVVRVIVEIISRRNPVKAAFNISQQVITFAIAVIVFRLSGGRTMLYFRTASIAATTLSNGLPLLVAFVMSFAVNHTIVNSFIAANSNRSFGEVWRGTHLSTVSLDVLASPIVFVFAYVYVRFGAYAAAALWIPVLGLRQLQQNNVELERTNSELLELLVKSMEARDPYTSGHSRRVQQYSLAIARSLGLAPAEIDQVARASLLHDVGKIHEKYAPILRKPGKLSPDEWQTMQEHPADGAVLVSTMSRLHDIVPSIRHHHERWDGSGYPDGLAGENIPRTSRIIALADTIDAMTSERPYRRTLSEDEVRAEVVRCRGTQFDPAMTDQVLSAPVWRTFFVPVPAGIAPPKMSLSVEHGTSAKPASKRVEIA
jgi:putative nucleotidyltransferase with HDIG domain